MPPAAFPLHQIALQAAQTLPKGAFAVAVTGSVARGNWHAASDLDLWVLGPRNARIHKFSGYFGNEMNHMRKELDFFLFFYFDFFAISA